MVIKLSDGLMPGGMPGAISDPVPLETNQDPLDVTSSDTTPLSTSWDLGDGLSPDRPMSHGLGLGSGLGTTRPTPGVGGAFTLSTGSSFDMGPTLGSAVGEVVVTTDTTLPITADNPAEPFSSLDSNFSLDLSPSFGSVLGGDLLTSDLQLGSQPTSLSLTDPLAGTMLSADEFNLGLDFNLNLSPQPQSLLNDPFGLRFDTPLTTSFGEPSLFSTEPLSFGNTYSLGLGTTPSLGFGTSLLDSSLGFGLGSGLSFGLGQSYDPFGYDPLSFGYGYSFGSDPFSLGFSDPFSYGFSDPLGFNYGYSGFNYGLGSNYGLGYGYGFSSYSFGTSFDTSYSFDDDVFFSMEADAMVDELETTIIGQTASVTQTTEAKTEGMRNVVANFVEGISVEMRDAVVQRIEQSIAESHNEQRRDKLRHVVRLLKNAALANSFELTGTEHVGGHATGYGLST